MTYLVVPGLFLVVDNCGSEATGGVDSGSSDGNGGQVNHEDGKTNGKWRQNWNVRVTCTSLGIGGRENGVDKDKCSDDLGT